MEAKVVKGRRGFGKKFEYGGMLTKMIAYCGGIGVEKQTSVVRMCEDMGWSTSVVGDLRKVAERVGGMTSRYQGGPKGEGGRKAYWTFLHDEKWIADKARELWGIELTAYDIEVKMPRDYRYNQNARTTPHSPEDPPPIEGAPDPRPVSDDKKDDLETDVATKLRAAGVSAKLSDAEALIEAARQYMGREAFIQEELERFNRMGIHLDVSAIKLEKDDRLETASKLVEYIDILERRIQRQMDQLEKVQKTGGNALVVADLKEQVMALKRKGVAQEEAMAKMREKKQEQERRIKTLEKEVEELATKNLQLVGSRS